MANPYHDAEGKFCSKGEMYDAIHQAAIKGNTEDYLKLMTSLHNIEKSKDPTNPNNQIKTPEKDGLVDIVLRNDYDINKVPHNIMSEKEAISVFGHKGSKYDPSLKSSEIVKNIREDLKTLTKSGFLPEGLKYSVRSSWAGYTPSITIVAQNLKDSQIYNGNDVTPLYKELSKRLKSVAEDYNYSNSNPQIDYFNNFYYASVQLEDEKQRKYREEDKIRTAEKRKNKPLKDNLLRTWKENPDNLMKDVVNVKSEGRYKIGNLPGTKIFVVARSTEKGVYYSAYDMTDSAITDSSILGRDVLKILSEGKKSFNTPNFLSSNNYKKLK